MPIRFTAERPLLRRSRVCLSVEDGMVRIEVRGVFDVHAATAVTAELHDVGPLADAVLLDLEAVTQLDDEFDLSGFIDEIQRYCWISGCALRLSAPHPSLAASFVRARTPTSAVVSA